MWEMRDGKARSKALAQMFQMADVSYQPSVLRTPLTMSALPAATDVSMVLPIEPMTFGSRTCWHTASHCMDAETAIYSLSPKPLTDSMSICLKVSSIRRDNKQQVNSKLTVFGSISGLTTPAAARAGSTNYEVTIGFTVPAGALSMHATF